MLMDDSIVWIFFVGPPIGAILGMLVYEAVRGSQKYAKGALEELSDKQE